MTTKTIKPSILKGFRDFLPEEMVVRNYVLSQCRMVFESFGFRPLETPALEYASTLLGKYGEEADRLVYTFSDKGRRQVGLRYDLTVPTARILAQYSQQLVLPFKRYQLQPVWRAEKPQKSRYREFMQCDIDIFGVTTPLADAEILAITYQLLVKLGLKNFKICLNSRQVLFQLMQDIGLSQPDKQLSVLQSIDKLVKQGQVKVREELISKGLSASLVDKLFDAVSRAKPDQNLKTIIDLATNKFCLPETNVAFTPTMVRGLDYYTGAIFETVVNDSVIGSIAGGGRYDQLISQLGGPAIPATGTTIGVDRICDVIRDSQISLEAVRKTTILLTYFPDCLEVILKTANTLRENGFNCEVYLDDKPLDKQIKYADKLGVPWVIVIGPDEVQKGQLLLKDMKKREQKLMKLEEAISRLSSLSQQK
jgi:histidyl-tRNA synthetase